VQTRVTKDAALDILEGSTGHMRDHRKAPHTNPLPPLPHAPISIKDLLATENELMRVLMQNDAHRGADRPQHH
jgi:hypothetical protein